MTTRTLEGRYYWRLTLEVEDQEEGTWGAVVETDELDPNKVVAGMLIDVNGDAEELLDQFEKEGKFLDLDFFVSLTRIDLDTRTICSFSTLELDMETIAHIIKEEIE